MSSRFSRLVPVLSRAMSSGSGTYRAVLCEKLLGPPPFTKESFTVKPLPCMQPGEGEVLIQVKAAAVNFPDILIVQGKYQFKPDPPFSPGSEIAGVVLECGEGVKGVKPNDQVLGSIPWGGYAEQACVPSNRLMPVPPGMGFAEASSLLMAYGTAYHALVDRGNLQKGETLLVMGAAGGVGLAAVQIGKALGARVVAAASNDEKLALCKENGADELVNYGSVEEKDLRGLFKQAAGKQGFDVIYDPVGGAYSEAALRNCAWKGRHLVIGFAAGGIPQLPLNLALLKGCSIVGVFWGQFSMLEAKQNAHNLTILAKWYSEGLIRPAVTKTYPLEQAFEAMNDMVQRRVTGKVVLAPDAGASKL